MNKIIATAARKPSFRVWNETAAREAAQVNFIEAKIGHARGESVWVFFDANWNRGKGAWFTEKNVTFNSARAFSFRPTEDMVPALAAAA